ncbi:major facilitator superfamily domain-containing protein [Suillus lakei]|nr:major facilitator superfamily domain-containing protein [Suillus lakei]
MVSQRVDEETPLLHTVPSTTETPLPWRQFSILLFLQLADPLASQVITPFIPQLIRHTGITGGDDSKVGYYAGLMYSVFFATQALTILHWSRASDYIGRKPVLLMGLFGLSASMFLLGLSKTFWAVILNRALLGALSGNTSVFKSILADITDATNFAQAYAYSSIPWMAGGTIGPLIGGRLARPADRFPNIFGRSEFMKSYPYFLACAVPATFSAIVWLVTFLFFEETVLNKKSFCRFFKERFRQSGTQQRSMDSVDIEHSSTKGKDDASNPLSIRSILVPSVIIAAANYAILALMDITIHSTQLLFFATPVDMGGLGLDPPRIGNILSAFGIANGMFQIFFFPPLHARLGKKIIYIFSVASGIPIIIAFPVINALARTRGLTMNVWLLVVGQLALGVNMNLAFTCIFMFIAAAAPNRRSLGATNGFSHMIVSIVRTFGPASAGVIFSFSIQHPRFAWLVYYCLSFTVFLALGASLLLPRRE